MLSQTLSPNSTYDFKLTATKNGAVWDLTAATVNLLLKDPSGTITTHAATLTNASLGIADYVSLTTDIVTVGLWTRAWQVVQGGINITSAAISFRVAAAP